VPNGSIELADLPRSEAVKDRQHQRPAWIRRSRANGSRNVSDSTTCASTASYCDGARSLVRRTSGSIGSKRRAGNMLTDTFRAMVSSHVATVPRRAS
jgi:hypothetical protein